MFVIIFFIAPVSILLLIYCMLHYFWCLWKLRKFPGPTPLPILGNLLRISSKKGRVERMLRYCDKYNGDFKLFLGMQPILFLSNVESLEVVLNSTTNLQKSRHYSFFRNWLGNGLWLSDGDCWHQHRKLLTLGFHFKSLDKYLESFSAPSHNLVLCLEKNIGKESFDIYPYINLYSLDVIYESIMGTSINAQKNSETEYISHIKKIGIIKMNRVFTTVQQYSFIYIITKAYRYERKSIKILHKQTSDVIDKKIESIAQGEHHSVSSEKKKLAFLDFLLQNNLHEGNLDKKEIREEVDTFLYQGYDTIASGIAFTLYCIANHPKVQEAAYEEILSILRNNLSKEATIQDLQGMKYLEAIINESLRLYPPIPFYGRKLTTNLEYKDKVLLKGMTIGLHAMGVHYNPELYPNPRIFDPERFLNKNIDGRNPYAFLPFSAGSRNCIGQDFGMLLMKSTICKLLRYYRLLPSPSNFKMELIINNVLRSDNGISISIDKRL